MVRIEPGERGQCPCNRASWLCFQARTWQEVCVPGEGLTLHLAPGLRPLASRPVRAKCLSLQASWAVVLLEVP